MYLNEKMDSSGRINKTLSNVSEEQQSSNTIISVIPDLKVTNNRVHPFSPKEDADATEFLIEGIIQGVYDLHDSKSLSHIHFSWDVMWMVLHFIF